jgi:hypothetical protein
MASLNTSLTNILRASYTMPEPLKALSAEEMSSLSIPQIEGARIEAGIDVRRSDEYGTRVLVGESVDGDHAQDPDNEATQ